MKKLILSLFLMFVFGSSYSQVLNLYLKGGVLPINTYDIDSIRLVPEQEIPSYDIKNILTSATEGWISTSVTDNYMTISVTKFTTEGLLSIDQYTYNNNYDSIFYNPNNYIGSYHYSSYNSLLFNLTLYFNNNISETSNEEFKIISMSENKFILLNNYQPNSSISLNNKYIIYEKNTEESFQRYFNNMKSFVNKLQYNIYSISKSDNPAVKSFYKLSSYSPIFMTNSIIFHPNSNIIFLDNDTYYYKQINEMYYDNKRGTYITEDGSMVLGFDPINNVFDLNSKNDSLIVDLCSPKVQEAINILESLHQEAFPSQSKFHFGWGKSSESSNYCRNGLCLSTVSGTHKYSMALTGTYRNSFNISIFLLKDENGNYDWSSNYTNYANKGMIEALNNVVSLFEGEFKKDPFYLTSTPSYFKLVSTTDPDIYFTWYIK